MVYFNSVTHRSYRYRLYPTSEQEDLLRRTIGCCRLVYNRALALRRESWALRQEKMSSYDLIKLLPKWKQSNDFEWLGDVSSVALQQSVCSLEAAFENFFAKRAKYPNFKKKSSGGSCSFTKSGFKIKGDTVWLAKAKSTLIIHWSRPLPEGSPPSRCSIRLTPSGEWYISFLCDVRIETLPPSDKHVGIDMGINALATLSTGEKVANPRPMRRYRLRLATAQRHLARKQKGSANSRKAKRKVARIHDRISETRKDQLHKLTTRLVRENQSIAIEDLAVRNMLKNHCLAGSISDASWGELKRMLEYKCECYGRELRVVDRWFPSSKTCHGCGHVVDKLPLNIRSWECPKCSVIHDRDVNAAINILSAGTVDYTCGGLVRPKRGSASRLGPEKQVSLGL